MPTISLCMIVKDEEQFIKDFLDSIKDLVDEIIVVDTGSKDKTVEIAKKFTDKIFFKEFNNNFSELRNFSIEKATKDWVLWLDPDERINKEDFNKIKELAKNKNKLGYSFIQKTYTNITIHPRFVAEEAHGFKGYFVRRICKLFQNNRGIKFQYPVHETVKDSIDNIERTDIVINHFPELKNREFLIQKQDLYLNLLDRKKKEFPESNADKEIETEIKIKQWLI